MKLLALFGNSDRQTIRPAGRPTNRRTNRQGHSEVSIPMTRVISESFFKDTYFSLSTFIGHFMGIIREEWGNKTDRV